MANSRNPQRGFIKFIGYLQVIGIILVVLGHSFHEYPDNVHGESLLIYGLCYNVHMPIFMFVSGFLMMYSEFISGKPASLRRFGLTKIKRLLIPYAVLTLLTYFPRAALSNLADDRISMSAADMLKSFYITDMLPIPYFWFLQAIFLLLIVSYAVIFLCRRLKLPDMLAIAVLIAISVSLGYIEWHGQEIFATRQAIIYSTFFIAGIIYCKYFDVIERYLPLDSIFAFCLMMAIWIVSFIHWNRTEYAQISSLFGIVAFIALAKLLVKHHVRVIDHLIGANYIIFLLSWYFNVAAQQILSHYVTLPWQVYTLLSLVFGIYIPWLGYIFLRDNQHRKLIRHISLLLGQTFR